MITLLADGAGAGFDWALEFRPFTAFHWITSGVCAASIAASSYLGVRWRGTGAERRLRVSWMWLVLATQVVAIAFFIRPPIDWRVALPFHICDLAGWVAFFALYTQRRWLRSLLYFWGIGLSTQAFLTPILRGPGSGYAGMYYWMFWGQHLSIVGSAVYDMIVLRFRPTWRDCWSTISITASWVAVMFVFNRATDSNYLFVGPSRPANPTIIDELGPYPMRVVWLSAIVTVWFVVLTAVWPSLWKKGSSAQREAPGA